MVTSRINPIGRFRFTQLSPLLPARTATQVECVRDPRLGIVGPVAVQKFGLSQPGNTGLQFDFHRWSFDNPPLLFIGFIGMKAGNRYCRAAGAAVPVAAHRNTSGG